MQDKTDIVLGPPGCGKTTEVLNRIERLISSGVHPSKIALLTFAKKAAGEAKSRALERFNYKEDDLPWYRTIHSLAFAQTGAKGKQLMQRGDFKRIAEMTGFEYRGEVLDDESRLFSGAPADTMLFLENLSRVTGQTLEAVFQRHVAQRTDVHGNDAFNLDDLQHLRDVLLQYKRSTGKFDYTDTLTNFIDRGAIPKVEHVFVDEAQDLSWLQWRAIEKVASVASRVTIAGDDDQAIFRWAGADVDGFLRLKGTATVLARSFRVPGRAYRLAMRILSRIGQRRIKEFSPREAEGSLEMTTTAGSVDASKGSWLFLARHSYQLKALEQVCKSNGWFYEIRGKASNDGDEARAVIAWENLRRGVEARACDVAIALRYAGVHVSDDMARSQSMVTSSDVHVNLARKWSDALTGMSASTQEYFIQAMRSGEKLASVSKVTNCFEPTTTRIRISTIHGAKGGEADGVFLSTGISESTAAALDDNPDDECRVFYVGVTRTKDKLVIDPGDDDRRFEMEDE